MLLLGLDTATPAVTVALHDGMRVLAEATTVDKHRHAELLAPAIAAVLSDAGADRADLTGVAVGIGPGPYTGLRVGVVTARVLGAALGIPVHGVCSLDVIAAKVSAANGSAGTPFLVTTDARRRELYWASYDSGGRRTDGPLVSAPAGIPDPGRPCAGEGPLLYPHFLPNATSPTFPSAAALCTAVAGVLMTAGDASAPAYGKAERPGGQAPGGPEGQPPALALLFPEPLYLRRPDAREPGAPKRVTETAAARAAQSPAGQSPAGQSRGARP